MILFIILYILSNLGDFSLSTFWKWTVEFKYNFFILNFIHLWILMPILYCNFIVRASNLTFLKNLFSCACLLGWNRCLIFLMSVLTCLTFSKIVFLFYYSRLLIIRLPTAWTSSWFEQIWSYFSHLHETRIHLNLNDLFSPGEFDKCNNVVACCCGCMPL